MENEFMDIAVQLEDDLADFYGKLRGSDRLPAAREALDFLRDESAEHSRQIAGKRTAMPKPRFNAKLCMQVLGKAKASVLARLSREVDDRAALGQLAMMEETVSKLYQSISDYLSNMARYYAGLSATFGAISAEEIKHRDRVLNKKQPSRRVGPASASSHPPRRSR
jgi:rubrerythrin